ncbi:acyl-homoserine-lactone synthase [Aquimonas voraii]|uniref:Acyl-homoserine-lactone synthase n=1 Tax=Aquimonas voraii TaxID=265719 RepID=A0A1G6XZF0_9GAMM|nr:acyl-homoserine-lactone synthase [Aquimonas voraii]SDD82756.1 acyl homoserine lactone synthase [Aquimonas voraii]
MIEISIARAGEGALSAGLLDSMFRLRAEVFHQRLGWDVRVEQGREHDWFDLVGPRYLVAHSLGSLPRALGCCRLLPSQGPNMLRDVFPELLDGAPAPAAPDVLEVSRFAVAENCTEAGIGFSAVPAAMVAAVLQDSAARGASAVVGVTSAAFERMLLGLGIELRRLGRARRIGRVVSLAFELPLTAGNLQAVSPYALSSGTARAA